MPGLLMLNCNKAKGIFVGGGGILFCFRQIQGAGEMEPTLRTLVALPEDSGSIPKIKVLFRSTILFKLC